MKFDYLIIGAGSAGCVLANRLTSNGHYNVALFEAGKPSDIWKVNMPLAILYTMHDPKYNYKYYSEPEPYLNNRKLFCPRGKMIGGCSAHNGMVYVRGNPNDYQRWASFGLKDWSYEKELRLLKDRTGRINFKPSSLLNVLIGYAAEPDFIEKVVTTVKEYCNTVKVYQVTGPVSIGKLSYKPLYIPE